MKICPNCGMTVDAESECPICYTTITYEKKVDSNKEKYIFNKYYVIYQLKNCWFSLISLIVVIVGLFFVKSNNFSFYLLIPIVGAVISFLESFFKRKCIKYSQWKYSEEYAHYVVIGSIITTGALAIFYMVLFLLSQSAVSILALR